MSVNVELVHLMSAYRSRKYNTSEKVKANCLTLLIAVVAFCCFIKFDSFIPLAAGLFVAFVVWLVLGFPGWTFEDDFLKNVAVTDDFLKEVAKAPFPDDLKGLIATSYRDNPHLPFGAVLEIEKYYYDAVRRNAGVGFQSLAKHIPQAD
ncbi:hypothetical protein [Pseudomonas sp. UMAB-40]|uniref:hypothetical protein n=1 Tax=Pseudomonas sp. UMAB-40 TaxID=1365407 RepID=UPI001C565BA1|nr:hypothetical protein [Pseudomonas sp. UMAB-40]